MNTKEHNLNRSSFHPSQMRSDLDNSSLCNSKTTILFVLLVRRGNLCKFDHRNYQNSMLQVYIVIFIIIISLAYGIKK